MTSKPHCPQCNSENIQKYDFYLSEKKDARKGSNLIVLVLLFLFLPAVYLAITAVGAVMVGYFAWPVLLALAVFLMIARSKKKKRDADLFICLVCGSRFHASITAQEESAAETAPEAPKRDLWRKK